MVDDTEAVRAGSQPPAEPTAATIADPAPLGLATAVAAWYASFAGVANFAFGREMVPVRALRPRVGGAGSGG